jgi:hypothetical protein
MKFMRLGDRIVNVECIAFIDCDVMGNLIGIIRFFNQDSISVYENDLDEFNQILNYIEINVEE